jgi:hypothetical protein
VHGSGTETVGPGSTTVPWIAVHDVHGRAAYREPERPRIGASAMSHRLRLVVGMPRRPPAGPACPTSWTRRRGELQRSAHASLGSMTRWIVHASMTSSVTHKSGASMETLSVNRQDLRRSTSSAWHARVQHALQDEHGEGAERPREPLVVRVQRQRCRVHHDWPIESRVRPHTNIGCVSSHRARVRKQCYNDRC